MLMKLVGYLERRGSYRMIARRNRETGEIERYLKRYYLVRTPWFSAFIHQFWSSDPDDVHDHPWHNITCLLKGGYHEFNAAGESEWRQPPFFRWRHREMFHRIAIGPHGAGQAWSFFVTFKRKREWGFMTNDGWIEATKYGELHNSPVEKQGVDYLIDGWFLPVVTRLRPALVD